eukprot:gene4337-3099_t
MACMAFVSLCLRRNCEELKQKRVKERQERRKHQDEEDGGHSHAASGGSVDGSDEHAHTHSNPSSAPHSLDHRSASAVEESFYRSESGLPPSPPHRQVSKHHSLKSRHSSNSDLSNSREGSPAQSHRKHKHNSLSRHGSRIESMRGSDYGSFAGLTDSYQRPQPHSHHGSDYGFGMMDTFDNSSHAGHTISGNASVVSDPTTVVLGAPAVNPHISFSDQGLTVLAFPCNNFGKQEPGTNAEIQAFVRDRGVTFNVMGKLECDNGEQTHPLYQYLKNNGGSSILGKGLKWNFAKFLCDETGVPVERYLPTTNPRSIESDIVKLINKTA